MRFRRKTLGCPLGLSFVALLLVACARVAPPSLAGLPRTQAERDRSECTAFAQTSIATDFAVDPLSKRLVTKPEGETLASYTTEEELKALISGLTHYLAGTCLTKKGYQQFFGFSILPPKGDGWTRLPSRPGGHDVVFAKALGRSGAAHRGLATVLVKYVELRPQSRAELVRTLTDDLQREWRMLRYKLLNFEAFEDTWLTADCLRYLIDAEDRGVTEFEGEVFFFGVRGFRCVNPDLPMLQPRQVLDVAYAQRFRWGQWQSAVDAEVEPFLNGLIFDPVSPLPYIIAAFESYATLLRELDQKAEAAEILARAGKLRQPGPDLGFNPAVILKKYAAGLREQDREREANEVEALSAAYLRSNFEQYLRTTLEKYLKSLGR